MTPARSTAIPRLVARRDFCMRRAKRERTKSIRATFVELARSTNWQIVRSDQRARARLDDFRAVLATLE